jgi:2-oxoisovalerate ferredoxin oxidoreductase beta subunit
VRKPLRERPRSFYRRFERKDGDPSVTHYCPGCGHGNLHKYIAEAIDDLGVADRTILVNPVGCSVFAYYYLDFGHVQAPHGRAPAVATATTRARPDSIVICYQGDGDLAAIGGNEILQAANRGEEITVVFVNNAIYGMTGGQMAPTTLLGQVTSTTPFGRSAPQEGSPIRVCELLGSLDGPAYLERVALGDAKHDLAARKAIRRALQIQAEGKGFSLVEVLSPCPTGWKVTPPDAAKWVLETMTKTFPLHVVREGKPDPAAPPRIPTGRRRGVAPEQIPDVLGLAPDGHGAARWEGWSPARVESRFLDPRIKTAGFGGQGVLFLGALIAEAGMHAGWEVSWLPSYGPEMRGGTAHSHVILSRDTVDSPLVTRSSVLFAMNRPSLERFLPDVVPDGIVIYDTSLIPEPPDFGGREALGVPATTEAERLGAARVANLVALGAYLERTRVLPAAAVETALRAMRLKPEAIERNLKALECGRKLAARGGKGGRAG